MRKLFRAALAALVCTTIAACGSVTPQQAQQIGCVSDAALAATSQTVSLTAAQKQAIAAGQAVAFVYCDGATTASAAAAASAPQ